ncbi:Glycine betaine methyltransferase [anaerobic digester metagenome]
MKKYAHFVSKKDVEAIHQKSLEILKTVGVRFEHPKALELFKHHGCRVEDEIVFFDERLIMDSLKLCPESFEMYSTKGSITIGNGSRLNMPACGCVYVQDDGEIRRFRNDDTINVFKLSATSSEMHYQYMDFFPDTSEFTQDQKTFSNVGMLLKYSPQIACYDPDTFTIPHQKLFETTVKSLKLIKQFEGVVDNSQYVNSFCVNSLSPLCYDFAPLEKMFAFCEENQPLWFTPCAMPSLTAPPSVFSTLCMTNAEILAGITLAQLAQPGIPVIYGNTSSSTNLRSILLSIGAPETALMVYAAVAMSDYYHIPSRTGGSLSDAKDVDFQAGSESMMMINATLEAGTDLILHACGIMGSFNIFSYEKFLLDEENISFSRRLQQGIDISEEKGCLSLIKEIGPRGSFLKGRTPKMYREEFVMPKYFNKQDPNVWQNEGRIALKELTKKAAFDRIASYQAPEITKEQEKIVAPYIPDAYKEKI